MLTLQEICEATGGQLLNGNPATVITSFHFDTRQLVPGSMFIAISGKDRDGHQFLASSKDQGAVAALISNPDFIPEGSPLAYVLVNDTGQGFANIARHYRKKLSIPVIAVTGSNGKTTTKDMIAHVLGSKKSVFKTFKNFNNHLGVPLSILQIKPEHEIAVLEMGMNHAGEIDFLASIGLPTVSVITNVTDAHIEHLGSRENIAKAKGELLPHTSKEGFAILNGDNPYVRSISHLNPGKTYFYQLNKQSDIFATELESTDSGTSFKVHMDDETVSCSIPMFGAHNVSNVLAAIFIARKFGYTWSDIVESLADLSISPMRFELIKHDGDAVIINDAYNASPTSMKSSIETFANILTNYRKILVLGDMFELGEESEKYHQEVGNYINKFADQFEMLVTIGENSSFISKQAKLTSNHFQSKSEAITFLSNFLDAQHAFLFKASRGMKLEEVIEGLITK